MWHRARIGAAESTVLGKRLRTLIERLHDEVCIANRCVGKIVYVLPLGSYDDALPTACGVGLLGGNGSTASEQTSSGCAGFCRPVFDAVQAAYGDSLPRVEIRRPGLVGK